MIFDADHYWLTHAKVPAPLMVPHDARIQESGVQESGVQNAEHFERDDFLSVDLEIVGGTIARIVPAGHPIDNDAPVLNWRGGLVWPCFVDLHTHLDKGHIWERAPNPDGTFAQALTTVHQDAAANWHSEDVYRRMEFGLKCSYAHGTRAIRTHIDASGKQAAISLEVFKTLRDEWHDRLTLQAVCLVPLEYFLTPAGEELADRIADLGAGGILGGVAFMHPDLDAQLEKIFTLARDRHLDLDFHADETPDPQSQTLLHIAKTALKKDFSGKIVCGHCCSLARQTPEVAAKTIDWVEQAGIGVVSLPMCNLYLQDRQPGQTPYWRGTTLLHELKQGGVPVAIASDNCRDPFYGYGDHDAVEVFSMSAKIAHLDRPFADWSRAITTTPADLMGLPTAGRIGVGLPADLVLFKARNYSELLSRVQSDRIVLRNGKQIDQTLPDYADLDDLVGYP